MCDWLVLAIILARCTVASALAWMAPPTSNAFEVSSSTVMGHWLSKHADAEMNVLYSSSPLSPLQENVRSWLSTNGGGVTSADASTPSPSSEDISVLRAAFAEMYRPLNQGEVTRDYNKAYQLLSDAITRWQNQPADERAGLYRVRGDCNMLRDSTIEVAQAALSDYDTAVSLLRAPSNADPQEYPAALLGRARSAKSIVALSPREKARYALSAAQDYRSGLIEVGRLSSMEDDEIYDEEDRLEEGMQRNPYATWEYGDALFKGGTDFMKASSIYSRASEAFAAIGDRPRSVQSQIDAGIALAAVGDSQMKEAETELRSAISNTVGVESRNVPLLQRLIMKEGEGRMALSALLWSDGQRSEAEGILGEACVRLDQLQAQVDANVARSSTPTEKKGFSYSIDDYFEGRNVLSCSDFKKPQFVAEELNWPVSLQRKVQKLETLQ